MSDVPVNAAHDERRWRITREATPSMATRGRVVALDGSGWPGEDGLTESEVAEGGVIAVSESVLVAEHQARGDAERERDELARKLDLSWKLVKLYRRPIVEDGVHPDDRRRALVKRVALAEADRDRYKAALEFYANSEQWDSQTTAAGREIPEAQMDRGKRARAALYPDQEGGGDGPA